jgi:hypothetical protein
MRDGLFLTSFPVQALPYLMAGAALLAVLSAGVSGRVLFRHGPARVVPGLFAASAALFFIEWALLGWSPRVVSVLLYLQSSVLGAIAISAFWSLLNERFDPHTAKPLMGRVAAAATLGGLLGGVMAERVAALLPAGALLLVLGSLASACVVGALLLRRGAPAVRVPEAPVEGGGWAEIRREPLLRDLALVVTLAAVLAGLADYILKSEAVAHFGKGERLVRFFGLFYSGTGLGALLIQWTLGRVALLQLGIGGSVASHSFVVGAATLLGFVVPAPWRGVLPRALDVSTRNSVFRAGYELLYTPLPEATKRKAKSLIDVGCDCAGKGAGAALILLLAAAPLPAFVDVSLAALVVAAAEFFAARRLRAGYVGALEGGLRSHGEDLQQLGHYSMTDFTVVGSMPGLDVAAVRRALADAGTAPAAAQRTDPVLAALHELRSGDLQRIRVALASLPKDALLVGALVPLLARSEILRAVVAALVSFGARAAGEMVSALADADTPDVVRRRLPLALKACPSPLARDGLLAGLQLPSFEVRLRCGRALLALTDEHPELLAPFATLDAVERELKGEAEPKLVREHVFNLLALALEREPVRIASRTLASDDAYVRGTALEYLETVLTPQLFLALRPLLAVPASALPTRRRPAAELREDLIRAGATMTVDREELRRQLEAASQDEG